MRVNTLLSSAGLMLATASNAMATPVAYLQDPVKIDVHTPETNTVWYMSPTWVAIGIAAAVLIIVLAIMASRGRSGTSTTVIK